MARAPGGLSAWELYCVQSEVPQEIQDDLRAVIMQSKVVLLLDDSGSMNTPVMLPGANPFLQTNATTRWTELMGDAMSIVQLVTSLNPQGIDVHFLNRQGLDGVVDPAQLAPAFSTPPVGDTPMIQSLQRMYSIYGGQRCNVLIILVTDGEPSDGDYGELFRVLSNKPSNFYVSLVECNDNEEEMDYLTGWDTQIARFHNQEDYAEELRLVRSVQGPNTKFTRANYVQMIVLSPVFPKYCIDIRRAGGKAVPNGFSMARGSTAARAYAPPPRFGQAAAGAAPPAVAAVAVAPPPFAQAAQALQPMEMPTVQAIVLAPAPSAPPPMTPWEQYCVSAEVPPSIQQDLRTAILQCKIVLLLDDSSSMNTAVVPKGVAQQQLQATTRWAELMGDAMQIVQLVTCLNPQGLDVHFMNRPGVMGVTDPVQLASCFNSPPNGGTPMISSLKRMYQQYSYVPGNVMVVLVTDGEPSDGNYNQLFRCLRDKPANFYVSLVECNDNEEEMDYLSGWNTKIPRFHNQEDYGEELRLVRAVQGPNAKFTRANYVQMIVLSPLFPKYAIDIRTMGNLYGAKGCGLLCALQ